MQSTAWALVLATGFASAAPAKERQTCAAVSPEGSECACGKGITGDAVQDLKRLRLTAICGQRRIEGMPEEGEFFFSGHVQLSGKMQYRFVESLGEGLDFYSPDLPWYLKGIRFDYSEETEQSAKRVLRPPALTIAVSCWEADVTLELFSLYLNLGAGTDADGTVCDQVSVGEALKLLAMQARVTSARST